MSLGFCLVVTIDFTRAIRRTPATLRALRLRIDPAVQQALPVILKWSFAASQSRRGISPLGTETGLSAAVPVFA